MHKIFIVVIVLYLNGSLSFYYDSTSNVILNYDDIKQIQVNY